MYKQTHLPFTVATLSLFLRDLQVLSLLSFSSDWNASVDWQESNRKLILAPAMLINNNIKCFPSENESVLPSVDRYSPSPIHLAVWKCLLALMSRTGQSHPGHNEGGTVTNTEQQHISTRFTKAGTRTKLIHVGPIYSPARGENLWLEHYNFFTVLRCLNYTHPFTRHLTRVRLHFVNIKQ